LLGVLKRKVWLLASSCLSVRLPAWNIGRIFFRLDNWALFKKKKSRKFKFN